MEKQFNRREYLKEIDCVIGKYMKSDYSGMSYIRASKEAQRLIETYGWYKSFDRLVVLYSIMNRCKCVDGCGNE